MLGAVMAIAPIHLKLNPNIKWVGIDIEDSPEVRSRIRNDIEFHSFDGRSLPFPDASFDMLYSNQVIEHVGNPLVLIQEMVHVLKAKGLLVGSTSHLEPYHSYSIWNFTPYGFKKIIEEAGLKVTEIRPGIDAFALILRRLLGAPTLTNYWWLASPLNRLIDLRRKIRGSYEAANAAKLLFCGQFYFICVKEVDR